jgi:hypothetical protein
MNEENHPAGIVLKKAKAQGLIISRVPQRIRDNFTKLAEDEFADDYGATLSFLWNNFELWTAFMQNWDIKLNYIIDKIEGIKFPDKPEVLKKMLSGKFIKMKGGQDETKDK